MKIFYLPDLGEGLPDAEVREWYVKIGDEVKVDQPLVAMETAKAVVDVPSPRSGRIVKFHGQPGDVINTGAALVEFEDGDDVVAEHSHAPAQSVSAHSKPATTGDAVKAIPAVRALAKKLNVDLAQVPASGANGQITLEDVERTAKGSPHPIPHPNPLPGGEGIGKDFEPVRGVRRAMVTTMTHSHQEVVPVTIVDDADIHAWPEKTDITLRVVRAIIAACKAEPALNAWFDSKAMARRLFSEIHLGLAMDSPDGLFVPVLKNIEKSSTEDLRTTINRFKEQVKARTIPQDDLKGATIVLSNVGIFAGKYANPIIVPPMVAILAMGKIRDEVVAHNGKMEIHRIMPLSITVDHRVVTGGESARFLAALIKDLQ